MIHFSGGRRNYPSTLVSLAQFCILSEIQMFTIISQYLQEIHSRIPCKYQNPQIFKSFMTSFLFVYNLCTSSHIFYVIFRLLTILIHYKCYVNSCCIHKFKFCVLELCRIFFFSVFLICGWLNLCGCRIHGNGEPTVYII